MSGAQIAWAIIGILMMVGGVIGEVRTWAARHRSRRKMRRMLLAGRATLDPWGQAWCRCSAGEVPHSHVPNSPAIIIPRQRIAPY